MEDKLISSQWLINDLLNKSFYPAIVKSSIESAPAVDAVPVRHGHWIHTDYAIYWTAKDECSECTYHTCDRDDLSEYNYCPNCGADMRGESDEE